MARPVDEKIVKLSMDNKQFQSNASSSVGILAKLSSALSGMKNMNLDKSTKALDDVNSKSKMINLDPLAKSAEVVANKFSTMGIIATTALINIANRAIDAGIAFAKSTMIDPIKGGFNEYELKMKSVQTIMTNTGESVGVVNEKLNELNTYSDKTVYSFNDMTQAIGSLSTSGMALNDSTDAVMGFYNLAAGTGIEAARAGGLLETAMVQAIQIGKMDYQNWKQLQQAGMGGPMFQQALIANAQALGKNVDLSNGFNESLKDGWATTDVMLATLKQFKDDQSLMDAATKARTFTQVMENSAEAIESGWAQTWEMLVGNFDEAGEMWTKVNAEISKTIDANSDARNALIKGFVDLGGRAKIIEIVANGYNALKKVVDTVKQAFREVFPPTTSQQLFDMASKLAEFTKKLQMSDETAQKVKSVFKGLFSIFDIGITVVKRVGQALKALIPDKLGGDILNLAAKFGDMITNFAKAIKTTEGTKKVFDDIGNGANDAYGKIKKVGTFIIDLFTNTGKAIKKVHDFIAPFLKTLANGFKEIFSGFSMQDVATGGVIFAIFTAVKKFSGLGDKLGDIIKDLSGVLSKAKDSFSVFTDLGEALQSLTGAVKAGTLVAIALAVMLLAISLRMIAKLKSQDISKALFTIAAMMIMLNASLTAIAKNAGSTTKAIGAAVVIATIAGAILILSAALHIIAKLNPEELGRSLLAMGVMISMLVLALKSLSKNERGMATSAASMMGLAFAILIMSSAVKKLSEISSEGLVKGVATIGALLLELAIFMKIVDGTKFNMASAISVVIIAGAIHLMVGAIKKIAEIDTNSLLKGLGTIAIILAEIAIFTKVVSGSKVMSAAVGMVLVAQAISMLIVPIRAFSQMSLKEIAKGLGVMAVALAEMVLAMRLANSGLAGAAGLMIVAAAMNMLIPPLQIIGGMSVETIAKGLITMGLALGGMALAAMLIGPAGSVALLAFAVAITAVGVAAMLVASSLIVFAAGLTALAGVTAATIDAVIQSLALIIAGIIQLIPMVVQGITTFLLEMINAVVVMIPALANAGLELILGLLNALNEHLPEILEVGYELVTKLMDAIGEKGPELIEKGAEMMINLINGLADTIRENSEAITQAILNLIEAILELLIDALAGIVETIFGWIPGVSEAVDGVGTAAKEGLRDAFNVEDSKKIGGDAGKAYTDGVGSKAGDAGAAGANVAGQAKAGAASPDFNPIGTGAGSQYLAGLDSKQNSANASGKNVAGQAKSGAGGVDFNPTGTGAGSQYLAGIDSKQNSASSAGKNVAGKAKSGAESVDMTSTGSNFGQGFANGISGMWDKVSSAASGLASRAKGAVEKILAIFSPSRVMIKDGGYFGEGFAIGIERSGDLVERNAAGMASGARDAVVESFRNLENALSNDITPVITPVLDLTNLSDIPDLSETARLVGNFDQHVASIGLDKSTMSRLSEDRSGNKDIEKMTQKMDDFILKLDEFISAMPKQVVAQIMWKNRLMGEAVAPIVESANSDRQKLLESIDGR